MPQLLACPNCNAPLPPPSGSFVTCAYCGATAAVAQGVATRVQPAAPQTAKNQLDKALQSGGTANERGAAAFKTAMDQGGGPERATMAAAIEWCRDRLDGVAPEAAAAGALALARAFDAENGTKITHDGQAMLRLINAYTQACVELRSVKTTTLNLPFLSATSNGPVHLQREVDVNALTRLLGR